MMALQKSVRCARCDYDLRASTEDCPECGYPVELSREASLRTPWWKRWWRNDVLIKTVVLITLYISFNALCAGIAQQAREEEPWGILVFTTLVQPVLGLIGSLFVLTFATRRYGPGVVVTWMVVTLALLGIAVAINAFLFITMATSR